MKNKTLTIILYVFILALVYYLFLPAINPTVASFWAFIVFAVLLYFVLKSLSSIVRFEFRTIRNVPKYGIVCFISVFVIIIGTVIVNFFVGPFFNAKSYARRIEVVDGEFTNDIEEVDFTKVPLLDKASSEKVGDRIMAQYSEYVSQFYVSDEYTQINYNNEIVRVTPLEYDGFIKWLFNKKNGIGAYITVNSVNGETKLVKLDKGMKYLNSAYFSKDLKRKLRFSYLFTNFGEPKFEIDNEGNPYYIVPTLTYTGIGRKTKVSGAIIFNPVDGTSKKYKLDEIPSWVDNVYPASLVIEQVNDWGTYQKGFLNSIFGQKNVVNTTEGYNYLALKDDIYLYTGITSVLSDESNLGFILTNLRTGLTKFYNVPGAEEYSAMDSAKGQVQQMNYTSTFPLLINLSGKPTYLVSLKDNAGLVKMYAFVDVTDYQKVAVTDASLGINKAASNYLALTAKDNKVDHAKSITVSRISSAVIDGNTYYYIIDTDNNKYVANIKISSMLPFVSKGDTIKINYFNRSDITELSSVEK